MAEPTRRQNREQERGEITGSRKAKLARAKWLLILAAVIGLGAFTWYQIVSLPGSGNTGAVGEFRGESFPDQGRNHIADGSKSPVIYNSNPPTSGPHYPAPAPWGIYGEELPDEKVVHNLEHGGIWITYKDLDDETLTKLKELVRSYKTKVILTPRAANDSKIAFAGWAYLDKFDEFDEGRIRAFIEERKDKGPEYFPD